MRKCNRPASREGFLFTAFCAAGRKDGAETASSRKQGAIKNSTKKCAVYPKRITAHPYSCAHPRKAKSPAVFKSACVLTCVRKAFASCVRRLPSQGIAPVAVFQPTSTDVLARPHAYSTGSAGLFAPFRLSSRPDGSAFAAESNSLPFTCQLLLFLP